MLVGTGAKVYKGAFLTLLPWGKMLEAQTGLAPFSFQPLQRAQQTWSRVIFLSTFWPRRIPTPRLPMTPRYAGDQVELLCLPSRSAVGGIISLTCSHHFNLCAVPLSINQISLPDPNCFLPGIFPPHFLLPNLSPLAQVCSKASLLTLGCGEKNSMFIAGLQARGMGSSCSKHPNSLMEFREGVLKAVWGVPVVNSCCCTAKTVTIFPSNYSPIKINKLIRKIKAV